VLQRHMPGSSRRALVDGAGDGASPMPPLRRLLFLQLLIVHEHGCPGCRFDSGGVGAPAVNIQLSVHRPGRLSGPRGGWVI